MSGKRTKWLRKIFNHAARNLSEERKVLYWKAMKAAFRPGVTDTPKKVVDATQVYVAIHYPLLARNDRIRQQLPLKLR